MPNPKLPIGVFDSGVGGLTVLKVLQETLPHEDFLYLGDTARLPYGSKSSATVMSYSVQASSVLVQRQIKCLVVACNTASSVALAELGSRFAPIPVIGVVLPGAAASVAASKTQRIAVIATEGTVAGGAYEKAIRSLSPQAQVQQHACGLYVALAEEGWTQGSIVDAITEQYLAPLFADPAAAPDTLVLGCTHFPVFAQSIQRFLGARVTVVDSAHTTAQAVQAQLQARAIGTPKQGPGHSYYLATDGRERFIRIASTFLQRELQYSQVEIVDLV